MHTAHRAAALAAITCALCAPAAQAAGGQITGFGASALQVLAGAWVQFNLQYSVEGSSWRDGFSNLQEPTPVEGPQEWVMNWYRTEAETPLSVTVQAAGQSFTDLPSVPQGGSHGGSWLFSLQFPDAGSFDISASGDWTAQRDVSGGSEIATRYCYNTGDPVDGGTALSCDSWSYSYPQFQESGTVGGLLGSAMLRIEVQAVPEPATLALWLLGGGLLALRRRRAPGQATDTGTRGARAHISS